MGEVPSGSSGKAQEKEGGSRQGKARAVREGEAPHCKPYAIGCVVVYSCEQQDYPPPPPQTWQFCLVSRSLLLDWLGLFYIGSVLLLSSLALNLVRRGQKARKFKVAADTGTDLLLVALGSQGIMLTTLNTQVAPHLLDTLHRLNQPSDNTSFDPGITSCFSLANHARN